MPVRTFVSALLFGALLAASASAEGQQPYDPATRAAIQDVISRQLAAFQHGDAKAAESFATPALQTRFPDPAKFLDMVKESYGALIKPRSTSFGETAPSPHGPLQKMTVVATDGTVWDAIYSFDKVDGQWRISGCGLEKDDTQQAI